MERTQRAARLGMALISCIQGLAGSCGYVSFTRLTNNIGSFGGETLAFQMVFLAGFCKQCADLGPGGWNPAGSHVRPAFLLAALHP